MKQTLAIAVLAIAIVTACNKPKVVTPPAVVTSITTNNLLADPTTNGNRFVFFSLENNVVVPATDSATTKWDIAFKGTTILINAGSSGPGQGGAFVQTAAAYDSYNTIPADSTFKTDAAPNYAIALGSGRGWYNYNPASNVLTPIPGRLLAIRTATGKYAKVEILSYYQNAPAAPTGNEPSRYYTYRFAYQPNGTKQF